mmetsp:Transcript_32696/g.92112  ORF Transcript_32696/g.92112 Transcript_32696/m.92112 type:complete len:214 (-) Transcript_32696:7-648(-)
MHSFLVAQIGHGQRLPSQRRRGVDVTPVADERNADGGAARMASGAIVGLLFWQRQCQGLLPQDLARVVQLARRRGARDVAFALHADAQGPSPAARGLGHVVFDGEHADPELGNLSSPTLGVRGEAELLLSDSPQLLKHQDLLLQPVKLRQEISPRVEQRRRRHHHRRRTAAAAATRVQQRRCSHGRRQRSAGARTESPGADTRRPATGATANA